MSAKVFIVASILLFSAMALLIVHRPTPPGPVACVYTTSDADSPSVAALMRKFEIAYQTAPNCDRYDIAVMYPTARDSNDLASLVAMEKVVVAFGDLPPMLARSFGCDSAPVPMLPEHMVVLAPGLGNFTYRLTPRVAARWYECKGTSVDSVLVGYHGRGTAAVTTSDMRVWIGADLMSLDAPAQFYRDLKTVLLLQTMFPV